MQHKTRFGWLAVISLSWSFNGQAAPSEAPENWRTLPQYQPLIQQLTQQNMTIKSIEDSAVDGLKEVVIQSGPNQQVIYLTADGEHLLDGQMMHLKSKQNLTEMTQRSLRKELMDSFKKDHSSIDFLPQEMTDHITVFTDIDCGYCRKLHSEVAAYNELGIGVSYLFFPRGGLHSPSHQKAVNVWCADDQQAAMTAAKSGQELPVLMCPNPIESQFNLGIGAGVHQVGTPSVVFADGTLIPGYLPPERMKQRLDAMKK
ncbi:thioredoxin fold domain-containing protein [Marinicella meishanensis]|uniref:thioredoxin fold domain-containing protein n=1 Tax=Marinicella meishanensis TaxID=2873263 RepID=UPI001CC087D8|nr:thioredoxin fold domain-containing protein [Marinicella sp. NBU2979]